MVHLFHIGSIDLTSKLPKYKNNQEKAMQSIGNKFFKAYWIFEKLCVFATQYSVPLYHLYTSIVWPLNERVDCAYDGFYQVLCQDNNTVMEGLTIGGIETASDSDYLMRRLLTYMRVRMLTSPPIH